MDESRFSSLSVKEEIELYGDDPERDFSLSDSDSEVAKSRADRSGNILHEFVDCDEFGQHLDTWLLQKPSPPFADAPFDTIELQKFDFSLEGVLFQQLTRMPPTGSLSFQSPAAALLSLEDFIYTAVRGVWGAFWDGPLPFTVASQPVHAGPTHGSGLSHSVGSGQRLGTVVVTGENPDRSVLLALLGPPLRRGGCDHGDCSPPVPVLREAIFHAVRNLLAGPTVGVFFVLLFDLREGGVVRVEGDAGGLRAGGGEDVHRAAAEWVTGHARVTVSSPGRIWNELGNPNWGDMAVIRSLLAVFHSIVGSSGGPPRSVDDLAGGHGARLEARRAERWSAGGGGCRYLSRNTSAPVEPGEGCPLEPGSSVWIEGSGRKKGYLVERLCGSGGEGVPSYVASPVDEPTSSVFLFVGGRPSRVEPTWRDVTLWYVVQRQARVLRQLKERGASGRHLPELRGHGRVADDARLFLATSPVGETAAEMACGGRFSRSEALRCCHGLLSALAAAASAGVRHGDVCPENAVFVGGRRKGYFVLVGWGRAVLEERDRPAMNLHYSSTYALQHGRLCSCSDMESLVYLLYHSAAAAAGIELPDFDSVEGALRWRERSWSKRVIQKRLGEASPLLKAFADYVDSLCGTPYPVDYGLWLTRLERSIPVADE